VSNPENLHKLFPIVDFVDDSVVSNADPPIVLGTGYLVAAGRSWILGECFNARDNPVESIGGK